MCASCQAMPNQPTEFLYEEKFFLNGFLVIAITGEFCRHAEKSTKTIVLLVMNAQNHSEPLRTKETHTSHVKTESHFGIIKKYYSMMTRLFVDTVQCSCTHFF